MKSYMASKHNFNLFHVKILIVWVALSKVVAMVYYLIAATPPQPDNRLKLLFNFSRSRQQLQVGKSFQILPPPTKMKPLSTLTNND